MIAKPAPYPADLEALATADAPYEAVLDLSDLPPGTMRRFTRGDLDVLLAHTSAGIVATDDRCPHMSAPLSIGTLDGCVVAFALKEIPLRTTHREEVTHPASAGAAAAPRLSGSPTLD